MKMAGRAIQALHLQPWKAQACMQLQLSNSATPSSLAIGLPVRPLASDLESCNIDKLMTEEEEL
jgi:hypothetical protein